MQLREAYTGAMRAGNPDTPLTAGVHYAEFRLVKCGYGEINIGVVTSTIVNALIMSAYLPILYPITFLILLMAYIFVKFMILNLYQR